MKLFNFVLNNPAFTVIAFAVSLALLANSASAQNVPFVIPGDDSSESATNFSNLLHKPAGGKGFVTTRDGKFYVGDERIRFWGMNLCFGANFPTHDEADKVAPHFAKLGVNSIRFHHMDMQDAPGGIWKTNADGSRELDPEQLDRLDYFIARLAENGIYANLNLHVSRTLTEKEGFPKMKSGPWWAGSNKWVMYYDPDVQAEVKKFCRDLLLHKNPYRENMALSADPAIGLVEMMNENFFSVQGPGVLRHLPSRFKDSFQIAWNDWLLGKYQSDDGLRAAWKPKQGMGDPLFKSEPWTENAGEWKVNANDTKPKTMFGVAGPKDGVQGIRFEPQDVSEQRHFQQFIRSGLSVAANQPYSLSFWVRSDKKRDLSIEVSTTKDGRWRSLEIFDVFEAGPEWKQVKRTFFPKETIDNEAYVAFSFGNELVPLEIAKVELSSGVSAKALPAEQSLAKKSIGIPDGSFPLQSHEDLKRFMLETERAWVVEMRRYLKEDCNVKVPITASQENYHGPGVLEGAVDYVDLHNYWHHPLFPTGKNFNSKEYTVGNVAIESYPLQEAWPARSLIIRTGWRYHGMPFTLSEWNHAEPGDVNTGVVMMAAVVGRLQDWDGVYFFDYESDHSQWFNEHFEGFFDFNSQPAKLAVFSVASNIFLRGDLDALKETKFGTHADRLDGRNAFRYKLGVGFGRAKADELDIPSDTNFVTPDGSATWDASKPEEGHLTINTPNTRGVWGMIGGQSHSVGGATFDVKDVDRNYATMVATSLDGKPIEQSTHLLVLASSGAENTDMQWNDERTSVSDQWGEGPTTINVVTGEIQLPVNGSKIEVNALDGTGKPTSKIPTTLVKAKGESVGVKFSIGKENKTLWYEVKITK